MQTVNFFIIFEAALVTAAGVAMKEKLVILELLSGSAVLLLSFVFFFLERRVRRLVKIGEDALRQEQARLAASLGNPALKMFETADKTAEHQLTYGKLFPIMFGFFGFAGVTIIVVALAQICRGASLIPSVG